MSNLPSIHRAALGAAITGLMLGGCTGSRYSNSFFNTKRDACSYIQGWQYPYDWKGSNVGACVQKLPPRDETYMAPDPFLGTTMIPQTRTVDNEVSIQTPIGQGIGSFEGNYVKGVVSTVNGDLDFICFGTELTQSDRGLCGISQ
jgi:hypothetical protein